MTTVKRKSKQLGQILIELGLITATKEIDLAPKELAVLEVLMAAGGAVVGPDELLEKAWDEGTDPFTNTVRMTVMTLRRKLGDPPVVHTVRGAGYRV